VEKRLLAQESGRDDFTAANVIRLARPLARSFRVAWSFAESGAASGGHQRFARPCRVAGSPLGARLARLGDM
jgi:hypothetical protein